MKSTTVNHQTGGNGQLTDAGGASDKRSGQIKKFAHAVGPFRGLLTTGAMCVAVLLAFGASLSCNDSFSTQPVPTEAYVSKPVGTLAPGDVIAVTFSGAPDLNTQQKIQPTGKVSLPTIGEVSAAGKSVTSLQRQLTSLYQPHLQDSTVTVSLAASAAGVYVSGAVLRPGKLLMDRPMTVMEAVMEAGGFSPMANSKKVVVVRTHGGTSRNYVLNLHQALHGTQSAPFYVRPYDVIYVAERAW